VKALSLTLSHLLQTLYTSKEHKNIKNKSVIKVMEYEFLKKNADEFLKNAEYLMEKGVLNLAAFNIEQAVQLYLKYLLAKKIGEFPKTHSIKRLIFECSKFCRELGRILKENINTIGEIEVAYISSRYYPIEFLEDEVKNMLNVAVKIREVVLKCLQT